MSKKEILFIVTNFHHNGAQREMYEFDLALDKNKFQVTILSLLELNTRIDLPDYFYHRHLNLGTKIIFFNDIIKKTKKTLLYKIFNKLLKDTLNKKEKNNNIRNLKTLFDNQDKVVFMGEYVYQELSFLIPTDYFKEILIFVMSSRFQSESYRNFNKENKYLFLGGFNRPEQIEYEFENFINYTYELMPLCLSVSSENKKWRFREDEKIKKIGIFTRLHKDKPLDPFFYAYQILLAQGLNIELHIFGVGNYKQAEYDRYINNLDLIDKIYFRGHQLDMKETIINEELDMVWFQGFNNLPAGYAGLEACLTGVPQLFWDFFVGKNSQINKLDGDVIYPHYKDLLSFVEASKKVLCDCEVAESLSKKQFQDVFNNRDIFKNIKTVEKIFLEE